MKKIKLIMPLLSAGLLAPTVMTIASCGNKASNISLDTTVCSAEQTTDANVTTNAYVFNVKNFDADTEELKAEIPEDSIKSEDGVVIEITKTEYIKKENKFYVYVTTSKLAGSLNDDETINFSIKFTCVKKDTQNVKWEKTIDSLAIKHVDKGETLQHFVDTNVNKIFRTNDKTINTITYSFPVTDEWTRAQETGKYRLSNLHVEVYQSDLSKESSISNVKVKNIDLNDDLTELNVTISFDMSKVQFDAITSYNLLFLYGVEKGETETDSWYQTMGGFAINYDHKYTKKHTELACSRIKWYYKELNNEYETATNFIILTLQDDKAPTYKPEDFEITSSDERIVIGEDLTIYPETILGKTFYRLAIPYTINQHEQEWPMPRDINNVIINIKSIQAGNEWEENQYGFSFIQRTKYLSLIGAVEDFPAQLKQGENLIENGFYTVAPFDISNIIYTKISSESVEGLQFSITALNPEYSKANVTIPTTAKVGEKYNITYCIMIGTELSAYKYTLTINTEIVE